MTDAPERRAVPWTTVILAVALTLGIGLALAGVYLLAGLGWALLAGALPCLLLAALIMRGLLHG